MTAPGKTESLDPITVEVVRYKLDGIANEMQSTLLRSSFSPIVKEGLDASASLFTADGTTLSQSCSIPIHLATLIPAVAKVLEIYPVDGMRDGDIYILNDPYTGGTHLPDIAVIAPVFHRGTVIALSGAMTHHQDVGGMSAGSVPTNATEIYQEGLRIPPLKLRDGGVFNDTLVKMIRQNVRIPDTVMGDLNAQVAACTVAGRRLAELADGYGHNQLASIFDELLQRSEIMTRKALGAIPEGTYRFVDYLDNDGIELDKPSSTSKAPVRKPRGRSIACRRVRWPRHASPCAPSPTPPSRPTAAASGRSSCACPRARSSTRRNLPPSMPGHRPSSASPAA
jgi:N-methylhydantoinase B